MVSFPQPSQSGGRRRLPARRQPQPIANPMNRPKEGGFDMAGGARPTAPSFQPAQPQKQLQAPVAQSFIGTTPASIPHMIGSQSNPVSATGQPVTPSGYGFTNPGPLTSYQDLSPISTMMAEGNLGAQQAKANLAASQANLMNQLAGGWLNGPAPWLNQSGANAGQQLPIASIANMMMGAYGGSAGAPGAGVPAGSTGPLGSALGGMDFGQLLQSPYGPEQIAATQNTMMGQASRIGNDLQRQIASDYAARGMGGSAQPATTDAMIGLYGGLPGQLAEVENQMRGQNASHSLAVAGLQQGQQSQGLQAQQQAEEARANMLNHLLGLGQLGISQQQVDIGRNPPTSSADWLKLMLNLA